MLDPEAVAAFGRCRYRAEIIAQNAAQIDEIGAHAERLLADQLYAFSAERGEDIIRQLAGTVDEEVQAEAFSQISESSSLIARADSRESFRHEPELYDGSATAHYSCQKVEYAYVAGVTPDKSQYAVRSVRLLGLEGYANAVRSAEHRRIILREPGHSYATERIIDIIYLDEQPCAVETLTTASVDALEDECLESFDHPQIVFNLLHGYGFQHDAKLDERINALNGGDERLRAQLRARALGARAAGDFMYGNGLEIPDAAELAEVRDLLAAIQPEQWRQLRRELDEEIEQYLHDNRGLLREVLLEAEGLLLEDCIFSLTASRDDIRLAPLDDLSDETRAIFDFLYSKASYITSVQSRRLGAASAEEELEYDTVRYDAKIGMNDDRTLGYRLNRMVFQGVAGFEEFGNAATLLDVELEDRNGPDSEGTSSDISRFVSILYFGQTPVFVFNRLDAREQDADEGTAGGLDLAAHPLDTQRYDIEFEGENDLEAKLARLDVDDRTRHEIRTRTLWAVLGEREARMRNLYLPSAEFLTEVLRQLQDLR